VECSPYTPDADGWACVPIPRYPRVADRSSCTKLDAAALTSTATQTSKGVVTIIIIIIIIIIIDR